MPALHQPSREFLRLGSCCVVASNLKVLVSCVRVFGTTMSREVAFPMLQSWRPVLKASPLSRVGLSFHVQVLCTSVVCGRVLVFSLTPLRFCMEEAPSGVEGTPEVSPPSAAPEVDSAHKTGIAGVDQEAPPAQGTGTAEESAARIRAAQGKKLSSPATPPKTPERDLPPPTRSGEHPVLGAETAPDVDTAKPEGGTTPAVHGVEGSDRRNADGHGSPLHGEKPKPAGANVKREGAVSKTRLLTFRPFSRDKKVNKPGDAAPPLTPVHGNTGEDGADHKGKERRKRYCCISSCK
jgi:hypothetical protein